MKEYSNYFFKNIKQMFIDLKDKKARKKQLANYLTFSRLLAPFIIVPIVLNKNFYLALILTAIFAFTDTLDGYFARKYKIVSEFGKDLDAIVDKFFATGLLIPLTIIKPILLVNVFGELLIAFIGVRAKLQHKNTASSIIGKSKTTILSITIALFYASLVYSLNTKSLNYLIWITLLFQILTAITYEIKYQKEK